MSIEDFSDEVIFAELLRRYPSIESVRMSDPSGSYEASCVQRRGDLWHVYAGTRLECCEISLAEGAQVARSIAEDT